VLSFFQIEPDFDLDLMKPNQTLFDITANSLTGLSRVMSDFQPENVIVQGDTTTTFCGALAAYYCRTKISHVEAGLRSGHKYSPYPEEANRILTGRLTDYHFAPTERARGSLAAEGITDNVWVVGNTVIDALHMAVELIQSGDETAYHRRFDFLDLSRRIVLVTGHRRESFGKPFENIANALRETSQRFEDVQFVYPVHLNPNVREPVNRILSDVSGVHLIDPLDYPSLVWLMKNSTLVVTDSGGIQEEAPSLGKPVLVMREVTERTEGVEAGTAKLVGTDRQVIVDQLSLLLSDQRAYSEMARAVNPYGDGTTSRQIRDLLIEHG
jgi:UDP-N-acetylglucosamine 2-epimerase (non-hydrolysing)